MHPPTTIASWGGFLAGVLLVLLPLASLFHHQQQHQHELPPPPTNILLQPHHYDHIPQAAAEDHQASAAACFANVTLCPTFAAGQLEHDYPVRYWKTNRGGCYFEFDSVSASCGDACDALLVEQQQHKDDEFRRLAAQTCRVGCGYARRRTSTSTDSTSCLMECKRTLWPQYALPAGLSLDKTCELGCLISNERACPLCDTLALQHQQQQQE